MDAVEPFVALVIYPTSPDAQSTHADKLARVALQEIRLRPGFLRGRVLVSEDGESLVTISEWTDRESFQRFGSWHPGVCQFVFCDGSVRTVSGGVDDLTLSRLAERSDGEVITGGY